MPKPKYAEPETESDEDFTEEEEEEVDPVDKINALPVEQRRRVYGMMKLVKETKELQRKKRDRIAEIERDFLAKMQPLFEARRKIICGEHDPTAAEIAKAQERKKDESKVEVLDDSDDEEAKKPDAKKSVKVTAPSDVEEADVLQEAAARKDGGIPHFWFTAMKNNEVLEGMVMKRDEDALKHLTNVTSSFIDNDPRKGFELAFTFSENPFFSNKVLTKKYVMDPEDPDYALEEAIGCDIDWSSKENKLTVMIKEKKQRHKSGKGVRIVQREEKCPSFFHFFDPPKMPTADDEGDEDEDDAEGVLEMDFEAGQAFHESVVPRAVYYYTGESIADLASGMGGMMDGDDEDDEDEDDEESESEEDAPPAANKGKRGGFGGAPRGGRGGRGGAGGEQPECKQQ